MLCEHSFWRFCFVFVFPDSTEKSNMWHKMEPMRETEKSLKGNNLSDLSFRLFSTEYKTEKFKGELLLSACFPSNVLTDFLADQTSSVLVLALYSVRLLASSWLAYWSPGSFCKSHADSHVIKLYLKKQAYHDLIKYIYLKKKNLAADSLTSCTPCIKMRSSK